MPLLGIDWQVNARNAIFGTLPGAISWESKLNKKFSYGANFRAITNSYRYAVDGLPGYMSIDENQLGAYADYNLGKHLVLNAEIGHSLFRKVKNRTAGPETVKCKIRIRTRQPLRKGYGRLSPSFPLTQHHLRIKQVK